MLFIDLKAPVITLLNQSEIETIETNDNFEVKIGVVEYQPFFAEFINVRSIFVMLKQISGDHRVKGVKNITPYLLSRGEGDSLVDYQTNRRKKETTFRLEGIAPSEVGKISFSVSAEDASDNISSIIIPVNVIQAPPLRVCENGKGNVKSLIRVGDGLSEGYCCQEDHDLVWVRRDNPTLLTGQNKPGFFRTACYIDKIRANSGRHPSIKRMERKW